MNDAPDLTEARMRAALNLRSSSSPSSPSAPRARHRYRQDGEVPVEVVNPRPHRPEEDRVAQAELERALAREREARQAAEKALRRALETIRQLQTRLAHAEIARKEATVPVPVPDAPRAETASRPKRPPQHRARKPAEDKPVEWWKPGWRERFRDGQR